MANTERKDKFNTIAAHFAVGAPVAISGPMGTEDGIVEFVGWDHYMDAPFVAVRIPSRFADYAIARMGVGNVFRRGGD